MMKTVGLLTRFVMAGALSAGLSCQAVAQEPDVQAPYLGAWLTEGVDAMVDIQPCTEDRGKLCGTITWAWDTEDQVFVGRQILKDFEWDGEKWRGGTIIDPEDDAEYRSRFQLEDPDRLAVRGCLLLFCRTQTWLRARVLKDALPD